MSQYGADAMDSKIEKKPFTLTLLGTLTEFTPQIKEIAKSPPYTKGARVKEYPKGETLSIVSSLIKTTTATKATKIDVKNPYSLQSDEVTVINGPKTDASNVGEKIALGLTALLKAIVRGQTRINIIAHSRGAVEAILIAHELETLQNIITACTTFEEVLKQLAEQQTKRYKAKLNNTPDIIEPLKAQINLIPKEAQEQWFNSLKANLPNLSINFFGIDPVAGDCFPVTWYDSRFFVLPEIIKNTELIYYANERSDWGFTPVCPEVVSKEKQNFARYSMPGHHGTGSSGDNASQQGFIVSPDGYKTTHVQKLMIVKLLNFLNKHGVAFNDGAQIFHRHSALGRKYLGIANEAESIDLATLDYATSVRTLYEVIAKNQSAYEAYNLTNYSYMGLVKQRRILRDKHVYGLFNDLFTTYLGYVNEEHASLSQAHFFKIFGLDTQKNPREMLNIASSILEENIKKSANKEKSILDAEMTRRNVLETFGIVIQRVSQHYLTDDWSLSEKQKEKEALYQTISDVLTKFKACAATDNSTIQPLVAKLLSASYISISNTLALQYQDLEKEFNCLRESIDSRIVRFFSDLLMQLNHKETPSVSLNELISSEEYKLLPNNTIATKLTYIYKKLIGKGLEKYTIEQLLQNYEEQFSDTIEEFALLYNRTQTCINDLIALRKIVPSEEIELDESRLMNAAQELIAIAAERFYKDKPLALPPIAPADSFMNLAEQHAIKHLGLLDRSKEGRGASNVLSNTLLFFWNPMSRLIYGTPVAPNSSAQEDSHKEDTAVHLSSIGT